MRLLVRLTTLYLKITHSSNVFVEVVGFHSVGVAGGVNGVGDTSHSSIGILHFKRRLVVVRVLAVKRNAFIRKDVINSSFDPFDYARDIVHSVHPGSCGVGTLSHNLGCLSVPIVLLY